MIPPLYDHQKKIIDADRKKCGLFLGTGASKTRTALVLAEGDTLVICPKQQRDDKMWLHENEKWQTKKGVMVISKEDLRKNWDFLPHFDTVIIDECFTGETEILTDSGFKKFKDLDKTEKVAQWDDYKISFVKPLRYIEREHSGDMISFTVKKGVDVLMTPNHNQVLVNSRNGEIVKKPISECSFHSQWKIPTSGFSTEDDSKLSPLERMYIATQADGSIHRKTKKDTTISFTFMKKRKIDRLLKIISEAGLEFNFVKHNKKRHKARIMVKMPEDTTKDIRNHIRFPMGYGKAKEITEEMVEWDGSKISNTQFYFSSKDKNQSDFYAQVAVLAGHRCYQSIEEDTRKETYSTMHRLFITLNKQLDDTQKCSRKYTTYNGKVYCVEVPSGKIVIRHNGFTFVTGNCHNNLGVMPAYVQRKKIQVPKTSKIFEATLNFLRKHPPKRLYLLSATPAPKPMSVWAIGILLGQNWSFHEFRNKYYTEIRMGGVRRIWMPKKDDATKERLAGLIKHLGYTGGLTDFFDVPEQSHKTIEIDLTAEQKKAMTELSFEEPDPLVRLARLRTIENGVLYGKKIEEIDGKTDKMTSETILFKNNKISYILERASEFPKLLIFANYTAQINEIARVLRKEGYTVSTLTGATKDRSFIKEVNESPNPHIIIAQCSISSGYELPTFPCVIFASKSFRYIDYEQALGRVLRSNALKKNLYIHLVVKGTDLDCHNTIMSGQDFQERLTINIE